MNEHISIVDHDIYIIPSSVQDRYIVYSPLRRKLFEANFQAVEIITAYFCNGIEILPEYSKLFDNLQKLTENTIIIPQERKIKIEDKAIFLLTQKCNLACSYCYAQEARSQDTLDSSKIRTIVDFIFSSANGRVKEFSFIGGGEPTVVWELFVWAVNYIKDVATKKKMNFRIGLTTNATLLDEERIIWLKTNKVHVGVSFDILPEIQDVQRGFSNSSLSSFYITDSNIKKLIANGFAPRIRSTITRQNVCLMPKMVEFVIKNYPEIKLLHFEHVTDVNMPQLDYYNDFIAHFFRARDMGRANGIEVCNSITSSVRYTRSRFCGGEFSITPTGDLVSCHRISSKDEKLFEIFSYGFVDDNVNINHHNLAKVEHFANNKSIQCSKCFGKWHCAGGCTNNRYLFSPEQHLAYCEFTKRMITKELESRLIKS